MRRRLRRICEHSPSPTKMPRGLISGAVGEYSLLRLNRALQSLLQRMALPGLRRRVEVGAATRLIDAWAPSAMT